MKTKLILIGMLLVFSLASCDTNAEKKTASLNGNQVSTVDMLDQKKPMPSFALPSAIDDTIVSSELFRNKVLVVTFFTSWCRSCIEGITQLQALQDDVSGQNFSVVGIAVDVTSQKGIKKLVARAGINYPVLLTDDNVAEGFGGITIIPTSFLINRDGYIVKKYLNHADTEAFREEINQLLSFKGET